MKIILNSFLFINIIAFFLGCDIAREVEIKQTSKHISKDTFNGHWPFYQSSGTLTCIGEKGRGAVIFNGKGVNGISRGYGYKLINGIPPWDDIIQEGLKLCK